MYGTMAASSLILDGQYLTYSDTDDFGIAIPKHLKTSFFTRNHIN